MKKFGQLLALFCFSFSLFSVAQEQESDFADGYISDDLFIYMHAGAGTNYRILGTIIAGTPIKVTGESLNDYSEIIDEKGRKTWVESKYVSLKPGLRFVVAELNSQIVAGSDTETTLKSNLTNAQQSLAELRNKNNELTDQLTQLTNELSTTKLALKSQDIDIQKEWFYNGAIVLVIGLLLGIILPYIASRKRKVDSWT
ncbi:TIGR04211 family SH3 domain-containing protein [Thalassotalea atypica]|uniref:TIGR04211 family SH3 domain-containing protein n=1 Tax=Thalassotalea atypica TaxID=2054316 RepID=UPI0025733EDE|nr:TIGR04211 family SH3 domain-containing protein [Thalassotalea atypica]